jgi:hypothetical protein
MRQVGRAAYPAQVLSITVEISPLHSKSPDLDAQSVSDTWGLAKVVRKVEFKLLHMMRCGMHGAQSVLSLEQQNRSSKIAADGFDFLVAASRHRRSPDRLAQILFSYERSGPGKAPAGLRGKQPCCGNGW